MLYAITSAQFATKVKTIASSRAKFSDLVQEALINSVYLCLKHSGGTTPMQQILDAVGTTAHRKGITAWLETYAPVLMRQDKLVLNKSAWKDIDASSICDAFDEYVESTGMNSVRWDAIAAKENTTESIFNLDITSGSFYKKLEKNNMGDLAAVLRAAQEEFFIRAIRSALPTNEQKEQAAA